MAKSGSKEGNNKPTKICRCLNVLPMSAANLLIYWSGGG